MLFIFAMGAAADYVKFLAFSSKTCDGAPQATIVLNIDTAECINSTSWNDPSGSSEGFFCSYPSKSSLPFGVSSSFLCYEGEFNRTAPLVGALLQTFPSRDSCSQQFNGFQLFTPSACLLNGPESNLALCDNDGVSFSRFHDATCAGTPYSIERYPYGCNLSNSEYFQYANCTGFPLDSRIR